MKTEIIRVNKLDIINLFLCFFIRFKVFVMEKSRAIYIEYDKREFRSQYYLLLLRGKAIGTGRIRDDSNYAIIDRISILKCKSQHLI